MLLKVVNLHNKGDQRFLRVSHYIRDYSVNHNTFYFRLSSMFMKTGLRVKTISTISTCFSFCHEHFESDDNSVTINVTQLAISFYWLLTSDLCDKFSMFDLNLIIKKLRTSRKVRKYSKGKLRYKSRLLLLRDRQIFGVMLRLWKICYNSNGEEGDNLRHRLLTSFFFIDESLIPETTPSIIQETMLDLYIKETSNSRK